MNNTAHRAQTSRFIAAFLTVAAVLFVWNNTAAAQAARLSVPDLQAPKKTAVDLHGSIGGANGWVGMGLNHTFNQDFALEVGGGIGVTGFAVALTPHWLIINKTSSAGSHHRLSLGAGLSATIYGFDTPTTLLSDTLIESDLSIWFNGELRYTYQHRSGFRIGAYAGTTRLLSIHNAVMYDKEFGEKTNERPASVSDFDFGDDFLPTAGVFTGYAF